MCGIGGLTNDRLAAEIGSQDPFFLKQRGDGGTALLRHRLMERG